MSDASASAAANLARAVRAAAAKSRIPAATLGTVVSDDPLTVELDTGQVVPNVAGPSGLTPGTRVLAHYINKGHDLAVQPMGYPYSIACVFRGTGGGWSDVFVTASTWSAPNTGAGIFITEPGIYIVTAHTGTGSAGMAYTISGSQNGFGAGHHYLAEGTVVGLAGSGSGRLSVDMRAPWTPPPTES